MNYNILRFQSMLSVGILIIGTSSALLAATLSTPVPAMKNPTEEEIIRHVADFNKQWSEIKSTPDSRYGIIRVLSMLNLDHPGLEKAKKSISNNDYSAAENALFEYFKTTRMAKDVPSRLDERSKMIADQALGHLFRGNGDVHPPVFRGADIDWVGPAFVNNKQITDSEWYCCYQRLEWWPHLAKAYAATSDIKYFNEWQFELISWTDKLLPFSKNTPGFVSRGMETYGRCIQMIEAFPYMLRSPKFDAKTMLYFLACFHEQADHIPTVYSKDGNHRLGQLCNVFRNAIKFPEFKRAEAWKNDAVTLLPKMMDDDVYSDGMNKELVFSYHTMYVGLFDSAARMFKENGYGHLLPDSYYERLRKMVEIYAMQIFPDYTVCQFGDGWKGGNAGSFFRKNRLLATENLPYAEFLASSGQIGTPPAIKSIAYPESGFYFFRSDWTKNAVFMPFKCAPIGEWHNQVDNGTFELHAFGKELMRDSGCYIYASSSPEGQKWRSWFRSTKAHQTLTLDERDTDHKPKHILWSDAENLTALVVENQSYPELTHRRTILFIDRKYFIIYDQATGTGSGKVRIHFQLSPGDYELNGLIAKTLNKNEANLVVQTFEQENKLTAKQEEGWIAYKIGTKENRPAWSWAIDKSSQTKTVNFLTALVPSPQGAAVNHVKALAKESNDLIEFTITDTKGERIILLNLNDKSVHCK